jgi:hypothetical protein
MALRDKASKTWTETFCVPRSPFFLIVKEDDSIGLFVGETERGKSRRKDMSPMGDKVRIHIDSHRSDGADYSLFLL